MIGNRIKFKTEEGDKTGTVYGNPTMLGTTNYLVCEDDDALNQRDKRVWLVGPASILKIIDVM